MQIRMVGKLFSYQNLIWLIGSVYELSVHLWTTTELRGRLSYASQGQPNIGVCKLKDDWSEKYRVRTPPDERH